MKVPKTLLVVPLSLRLFICPNVLSISSIHRTHGANVSAICIICRIFISDSPTIPPNSLPKSNLIEAIANHLQLLLLLMIFLFLVYQLIINRVVPVSHNFLLYLKMILIFGLTNFLNFNPPISEIVFSDKQNSRICV